ncbi:helix-turn-helix domain-containing protein [Variovorax sp. KK3]|uniref:helix-turn-helix domain-containing protein n=1 Tax=Variovorax sp. KK3 TaxID=1855728 RepID=UPI00097C48C0|nr:helix-turn-helix transcriptional regulator [Variovorax sp. KK3]
MSLDRIAQVLRQRLRAIPMTQERLREAAGISKQTLTHVLGGRTDYRLTTLLAVADKLGFELVLVPKGAAEAVQPGATASAPAVKSRVQAALDDATQPSAGKDAA